ncbi:epoxide hydrolase family protein [Pseudonocardia humida]|uniref:Alpha/beta fold hydrolase n=1 Tax=Pseudonocardia humida TaxID=2800819 RepID=A0ABT0ZX32_9PSEU|nr:epoxide hydrolase family protein [Pseudonocardia humida]MCO1655271.1 alpha/beta fold hydrolase [Pseudonocardia humida]
MTGTEITPFRVDVPQAALDDLADRLRRAIRPSVLPGTGDRYGVPADQVEALAAHWLEKFDWRAVEARINAFPQFTTEIDGERIHFLHVRSARQDATPLVLTHGWPGSVFEFLGVVEPLTAPAADQPAFHVVIPSLPGVGFSGPTTTPGWGVDRTARAWVELMHRLGYDRYLAAGSDTGSMISPQMGRIDPDGVLGVHVAQVYSFPSGDPAEFEGLTPEDYAGLARMQWFQDTKSAFNVLSSQQPQTLAYALADSPLGLLAWNAQLFAADEDPDFVLSNIATYWFTGTASSSIRFYYEAAHADEPPTGPTTVPLGLAMFGGDFHSVRRFAERDHSRIVSWNAYDMVAPDPDSRDPRDHYAAHQHTDTWLVDLRAFVGLLPAG